MITKLVYFIWFGNSIPDFLNHALSVFKLINPGYEFKLITRSVSKLDDIYHSNSLSEIDSLIKLSLIEAIHKQIKLKLLNKLNLPIIVALSDILRVKLLNMTGGIYLDSDTFPIKPFDDKLLQLNNFLNSRLTYDSSQLMIELNFAGGTKGEYICSCKKILPPIYEFLLKTTDLLNKFYLCKILYGDYYGNPKYNYVDHYDYYTWNPNKCLVSKTSIDKELENKYDIKINWATN